MHSTHEVYNQVPPLHRENAYLDDLALQQGLENSGGKWAREAVTEYGSRVHQLEQWGEQANHYLPELHAYDRYGHRIDTVIFHDSYHHLMTAAKQASIHALPWQRQQLGSQAVRLCLEYLHIQGEAGTACPISMTYAGIPLLEKHAYLQDHWLPKALEASYDASNQPISQKSGLTLGMAMTEKQGGSDVRANQTMAKLISEDTYELTGHKWFCSAPMSDGFFVTAQAAQGLTCFLVPRWRPDDTKNTMHLMRLKNKLGNRANASSEVEFDQAFAWRVGEEGAGIKTIINMVAYTRFDCMIGSVALMRQALVQAYHHATHRQAFSKHLIEHPLMRQVLAEAALEIEGHLMLCFDLARLLDDGSESAMEKVRLLTALGKYWICKRTPTVIVEMMECLGGAGYIEDFPLARLYREAPLNAIWEGCGNIQCLDLLRMMQKTPELIEHLMQDMQDTLTSTEAEPYFVAVRALWQQGMDETKARILCESLARCYQAHLLAMRSLPEVSEPFMAQLTSPQKMLGSLDQTFVQALLTRIYRR